MQYSFDNMKVNIWLENAHSRPKNCGFDPLNVCNINEKHLKNVGPIRHCDPPNATCSNFTLPFTRCRYCRHHYQDEEPKPAIAQAACNSSDTWWMAMYNRCPQRQRVTGDRYGPIEWAQSNPKRHILASVCVVSAIAWKSVDRSDM